LDDPTITTDRGSATVGSRVAVDATGFMPGSEVEIWLESTPVLLASVVADGTGSIATIVRIPTTADEGDHHIVARGEGADGEPLSLSAALMVIGITPPSTDMLPPGVPHQILLAMMGLSFLVMAFAVRFEPVRPRRS